MMAFNKLTQKDITRLSGFKVPELRIIASDNNIRGYSRMTKSQLAERIAVKRDQERKNRRNERERSKRATAKEYKDLPNEQRAEKYVGSGDLFSKAEVKRRQDEWKYVPNKKNAGKVYPYDDVTAFWDIYKEMMGYV